MFPLLSHNDMRWTNSETFSIKYLQYGVSKLYGVEEKLLALMN